MAVIAPERFLRELYARGFDYFTGVPCSLLKGLMAALAAQDEVPYVAAPREDQALGVAAGAYLAGRKPVLLMQNSGLGVSVNALLSLSRVYKLPCLLLVTWRGYRGEDAPEHRIIGPATEELLATLGLPYRVLAPDDTPEAILTALDWAACRLEESSEPCVLLCRKGALS